MTQNNKRVQAGTDVRTGAGVRTGTDVRTGGQVSRGGYNPRPVSSPNRSVAPNHSVAPSRSAASNRGAVPGGKRPSARGVSMRSGRARGNVETMPRGFWKFAGFGALTIVLALVLQYLMPDGFPLNSGKDSKASVLEAVTEIHSNGPIRINEIMTSNGGVLVDAAGTTPDWVEIANVGNSAVNLSGYSLSKSANASNVFTFPDVTLQPGTCLIIIADSRLVSESDAELHAPFRLSSTGDVLMLFNAADVAIDTVNIPALSQNTAYVRQDANTWVSDTKCTPGMLNTEENYLSLTTVTQTSPLQISEIVSNNTQYAPDENGICHDYIIIRNTSNEAVDLSGYYLSDTQQLTRMWRFPDGITLAGNSSLLVYASGLNRTSDSSHLHTNFKLSSEGEQVVLSNALGQPLDIVTFDLLKTDTAYLRGADGAWSVGTPTAGN